MCQIETIDIDHESFISNPSSFWWLPLNRVTCFAAIIVIQNDVPSKKLLVCDEWILLLTVHFSKYGSLLLKVCSMAAYDASYSPFIEFAKHNWRKKTSSMKVGDSFGVCLHDL